MHSSLVHDSRDIAFRRPYGAVPCGTAVNIYLNSNAINVPKSVHLRVWSKTSGEKILEPLTIEESLSCFRYEFIVIAPEEPDVLWYHFRINYENSSVWYAAPSDGLGGDGVAYATETEDDWQITVYDASAKVPGWYTHGIMYQIFPDRFYRGDQPAAVPELPAGALYHPRWDDWPFYAKDPQTGNIAAYDFFGGTLDGIVDKIPYLKSLGISILYLNPIFESVSNHKYDTGDYKKVDAQFGGEKGFARLQAAAADAGIHLILDGVFSHTGSDSLYFKDALRSKDSSYYPWYRFTEYPNKYDCWWGVTTLPNVDEMEPSYRDFIISGQDSVIKHWLKRGASGWRLDVVDELPGPFVQEMFRELKLADPQAVLVGEVWEDASHKKSYGVIREYLLGRELDSVINYPFRSAVIDYFTGRCDADGATRRLESLNENYPTPYFYSTMNVLGTHDVPRILTLLGGAPSEDRLTKLEQALYHLPANERQNAMERLKLAALVQFSSPGVPCVYYGDEAGMEGYSDPQNRRSYPWGNEEQELVEWYRRLGELRRNEPVLRTGRWIPLQAGPDILAFGRRTDEGRDALGELMPDAAVMAFFNRSASVVAEWIVDVSKVCAGPFREIFGKGTALHLPDSNGLLQIALPPLSALVLKAAVHPVFAARNAGILLHPTSLGGPYGIGDIGPSARAFVDWLTEAGQTLWQVLPLTPVDFTGSPYQSASAFAGNPLLISPEDLVSCGLLNNITPPAGLSPGRVEYEKVTAWKNDMLRSAFENFRQQEEPEAFRQFCREASGWLEDYSLFMALKTHFEGAAWTEWESGAAHRAPEALQKYGVQLAAESAFHRFVQYLFFTQWEKLRQHATDNGIHIVGDLPIFVSHDSADVWAFPYLFSLDKQGRPRTRAGVPPDYFSCTGQLWGNPHYDWAQHSAEDYKWWVSRLRWLFRSVDMVRIDHFRGFEAFWEIPSRAKTAVQGKWVKGPAEHFFNELLRQLGEMPILAEDLGVITPEVVKLKEAFFLPGMLIMPFEIWPEEEGTGFHLPEPQPNTFYYTGTHDNDTLLGWLKFVQKEQPELYKGALSYAQAGPDVSLQELVRELVARVMRSEARTAMIPIQDWLGLDTDARMNLPATSSGNWAWRLSGHELTPELARKIRALVIETARL